MCVSCLSFQFNFFFSDRAGVCNTRRPWVTRFPIYSQFLNSSALVLKAQTSPMVLCSFLFFHLEILNLELWTESCVFFLLFPSPSPPPSTNCWSGCWRGMRSCWFILIMHPSCFIPTISSSQSILLYKLFSLPSLAWDLLCLGPSLQAPGFWFAHVLLQLEVLLE